MDAVPATVTHSLSLRLLDASGPTLRLTAELRYDVADPYAVDAVFRTGDPDGVRWVFARDLLADGLCRPSGDGDVTVAPLVDERGRSLVLLELRSPDGHARLQAPAGKVGSFLATTYRICPAGTETDRIDLNALTGHLLGETGPL